MGKWTCHGEGCGRFRVAASWSPTSLGVASYLLFDLTSASRVPPHPCYSRGHGVSGIAKATVACILLALLCDRVGTCPRGTRDLL